MNPRILFLTTLLLSVLGSSPHAAAAQHRATRLGNPATRFAPPLATPEDLRARFADPNLRPDIVSILNQTRWQGDVDDLFRAAASAPVSEIQLPTGTRMPYMSFRERGKPVALIDVLWAGKEPVPTYAFTFTSKGRFYRCVTPRPCSNFYLEDWGAPTLALDCTAPAEVPVGRPAEVCLLLRNTGDAPEPASVLSLPIPSGATLVHTTPDAVTVGTNLLWRAPRLPAQSTQQYCAVFTLPVPGSLRFTATAAGTVAQPGHTSCETRVIGIPAILIDAIDLEDPVEAGKEVTYEIKITNQGSIACSNLRVVCSLPENEQFISGSGPTQVTGDGSTVTTEPLPSFPAKDVVTWRIIVKALKPGDVRFRLNVHADEFATPIYEEESTLLYE